MTLFLAVMLAITPADAKVTHDTIGSQLAPAIKLKLEAMAKTLRGSATLESIEGQIRASFPERKLTTADVDVLSFFVLEEAITLKEQQIESIRARGGKDVYGPAMQTTTAEKNNLSRLLTILTNLANMRHEMLKGVANNLRG